MFWSEVLYITRYGETPTEYNVLAASTFVGTDPFSNAKYSVFSDMSQLQSETVYTVWLQGAGVFRLRNIAFRFLDMPGQNANAPMDIGDIVKYIKLHPETFQSDSEVQPLDLLNFIDGRDAKRRMGIDSFWGLFEE